MGRGEVANKNLLCSGSLPMVSILLHFFTGVGVLGGQRYFIPSETLLASYVIQFQNPPTPCPYPQRTHILRLLGPKGPVI